jgi:hypothetical protein
MRVYYAVQGIEIVIEQEHIPRKEDLLSGVILRWHGEAQDDDTVKVIDEKLYYPVHVVVWDWDRNGPYTWIALGQGQEIYP